VAETAAADCPFSRDVGDGDFDLGGRDLLQLG
jgi:hypothetical protein